MPFLYFQKSTSKQNYRASGIYKNNHYKNVIKSMNVTSNSKHRANRKHKQPMRMKH